ncbi:unnamed protein product, partial [Mesorhabditis belari]|uniref:Uncharacterized protein n=1 Tax=Mesorhabditis belari TaxID=2138241 RepID=A0AAF3EBW2_9BILA
MLRRLGAHQTAIYRCESPSQSLTSLASECTLPISMTPVSEIDPDFHPDNFTPTPIPPASLPEERIVDRKELTTNLTNVANKLSAIVSLMSDFSMDASKLRESAEDLLEELTTQICPSLIALDLQMIASEALLKYNLDRANIQENRINWLLILNRYQKEMRRILAELSGPVYREFESSLELRFRGVIGRRPSIETMENLHGMRDGMKRALQLLVKETEL